MTFPTRFGPGGTGAHPANTPPPGQQAEAKVTPAEEALQKQAEIDASKASALQGDKT